MVSGKKVPKFGLPASGCPQDWYGWRNGISPAFICAAIAIRAGRWVITASW